ncbi:MAG: lipopolysaccharide heptosyltransferase II [Acidobacteria bacterium]|nr:lipopolysaccharide heptosyltransferase II [Acidobacteriota bacterium]
MTRPIPNILIRGTNWIGDSVISLPALREIRRAFAESRLSLLVKPWVADLFTGADFIDETIPYDRRPGPLGFLQFVRFLRKKHFDAAILLQNAFEAAALAFAAGIPIRVGFPTDGRRFLLTHPLEFAAPVPHEHQIYDYLNIAAQSEMLLTGNSRVDFLKPQYRLPVDGETQNRMRRQLLSLGWVKEHRLIAVNPGAANNPLKRWFPDRFARLSDKLLDRGDCTVVLIGAPSEESITDEIISRMRQIPIKLTGRTSLAESIAALSLSDLAISNDTGPAYIAAALCRPTITIFGPTNYRSICPTSPTSQILNFPVPCAPCRLKRCPTDHECMKQITVERVYMAALDQLGLKEN